MTAPPLSIPTDAFWMLHALMPALIQSLLALTPLPGLGATSELLRVGDPRVRQLEGPHNRLGVAIEPRDNRIMGGLNTQTL